MDFKHRVLNFLNLNDDEYSSLANISINDLENENNFINIDVACSLIKETILNNEKIMIYGDYDVDGLSSITIMLHTFELLNYQVGYYVPSRYLDGYGLTLKRAEDIVNKNYQLVILVDNGVTAVEGVNYLINHNVKVLILDHHEYSSLPNEKVILVHPFLRKKASFNACASYVCFFVSKKILGKIDDFNLVYASLATISDVMPLKEYNYALVKEGLKVLNKTNHPIKKLSSKIILNETDLSFEIIPKLNAYGRVKKDLSINRLIPFLLNHDDAIISEIEKVNIFRKNTLNEEINKLPKFTNQKIIIYYDSHILEGLLGLLSQRISINYQAIAIAFTDANDDIIKGSARTYGDFNILSLFELNRDILITHGGHSSAGGLSLKKEYLPLFKERCETFLKDVTINKKEKKTLEITIDEITIDNVNFLNTLRPFGKDFEEIKFSLKVNKDDITFSKNNHSHIRMVYKNCTIIGFNLSETIPSLNQVYLIGHLEINNFNNQFIPQLRVDEIVSEKY